MIKKNEKVVIIIPIYNEADVIADTINTVLNETLQSPGYNVEVLVFDSNSTDDSVLQVKNIQQESARVHLQSEKEKSGLGSAYLQAMRYAMHELNADIVFEFDADGSHQPKYLNPMLDKMKSCDVVVGSRYVKHGSIPQNWGWDRKLFSILGNQVARLLLTRKHLDFTSGFRATRCSVLKKILPDAFLSSQYAYKLHLFWLLHKAKAKIVEHPIDFIDREIGYSKLPRNSILDSLRVVFTLRFIELRRYFKMCLVGLSGAVIQFSVYNLSRNYYSPMHATQLAVMCAIFSNYVFNNKFTFKLNSKIETKKIKRFALYGSYSLFIILMQSFWMHFAVTHISQHRLLENVFVGIGIVLGSFLNYYFYSRVIWSSKLTSPKQS